MNKDEFPKVSFIIPVLNEEKTIVACLDSISKLKYPKDKIEILIAEGPSEDKTHEILMKYKEKNKNIKLIKNPTGNTSVGRNICIENSTGELLMNYSGHVTAKENLLEVLVSKLMNSPKEIAAVGCSNISPEKQNYTGETAGVSFSSFMGGKNLFVQNAEYEEERYSDHISFSLYRKKPVIDAGSFDPEFWCGQDAELDLRLTKAGYKILYTPNTKVYHYKRTTIKSLSRQMYRYGIARAKMVKKHPKTLKFFHLIGPGFIAGIILLLILTIIKIIPIWVIPLLIVIYILAGFISSITITKKPKIILLSVLFYLLIHVGYGLGFIRGIFYSKL
jgi:GT2 family glycosyltransferase